MSWNLRYRRRVRIAPGIALNLGKRGASLSAGVRGAHVTIGRRPCLSLGVPGTGLSMTRTIGTRSARRLRAAPASVAGDVMLEFERARLLSLIRARGQAGRSSLAKSQSSGSGGLPPPHSPSPGNFAGLGGLLKYPLIAAIIAFALLVWYGDSVRISLLAAIAFGVAVCSKRHGVLIFFAIMIFFGWLFGWPK